jgi:hypothetical protein
MIRPIVPRPPAFPAAGLALLGLTLIGLAAAAPAMADGIPDGDGSPQRPPPGVYGRLDHPVARMTPGTGPLPGSRWRPRLIPRDARSRSVVVATRVSRVRPLDYGVSDGETYTAWLPRNTNLPIYNIPPPFFAEP